MLFFRFGRRPHPAATRVSERENIILKSVMHELSLELDTPLISTAKAANSDKSALRLMRELITRKGCAQAIVDDMAHCPRCGGELCSSNDGRSFRCQCGYTEREASHG